MTKKLIFLINKFRTQSYFLLIIFLIFGAFLETFSIAAIYPFMKIVMDKENYLNLINYLPILNEMSYFAFINLSLVFLVIIYLLKLIYLCFLGYKQTIFVSEVETNSAKTLYEDLIYKNYHNLTNKDSGYETSNIINDSVAFGKAALVLTTIIIEVTILLFIGLLVAFIIDIKTIFFLILFVLLSYIAHYTFKDIFQKWGEKRRIFHGQRLGIIHETMNAYKVVKVMRLEKFFLKKFIPINIDSIEILRKQNFATTIPRYFYEFLAITCFVVIFYFLMPSKSIDEVIPIISVVAATAFRTLPSFSRIFQGLQGLKYFKNSVEYIYNLINDKKNLERFSSQENKKQFSNEENVQFNNDIVLKNINFSYQNKNFDILKNLNLVVKKNDFIGILGQTGAGKSTLLDIISGLLVQTSGEILVDGKNIFTNSNEWQSKIGYVQQHTSIFNDSLKNNIILNKPFDEKYYNQVIQMSDLQNFESKLAKESDISLGEMGSKISGGEMQRIGIARSLYIKPEILIMDEPTSSLDAETEQTFLENLRKISHDITIFIISHKLSTLKYCRKIYHLEDGKFLEKN